MYTFVCKERHAKAFGRNLPISTKNAKIICRIIRGKKLSVVIRFLNAVLNKKTSINGKYYTKTVQHIKEIIESCIKNAEHIGLDTSNTRLHISCHKGTTMRRNRRKYDFGSRMKSTHVEVMLIEVKK